MKQILSTFTDINLNRNEGTIAFILHRLTGLCLAGYIFLHLLIVGSEFMFGTGTFNKLMGSFEWPLFKLLEIGLIAVIAYHLINGSRIVAIDLMKLVKAQKVMFYIVMALCIGATVITAIVFLPKIIR